MYDNNIFEDGLDESTNNGDGNDTSADSINNLMEKLNISDRRYLKVMKYCREKKISQYISISSLDIEERLDIWNIIKDDISMTYLHWISKVKTFSGGNVGNIIAILTVIVTGFAAVQSAPIFPSGQYPKLVLALPGIMAGASFFVLNTYLYWNFVLSPRIQRCISFWEQEVNNT